MAVNPFSLMLPSALGDERFSTHFEFTPSCTYVVSTNLKGSPSSENVALPVSVTFDVSVSRSAAASKICAAEISAFAIDQSSDMIISKAINRLIFMEKLPSQHFRTLTSIFMTILFPSTRFLSFAKLLQFHSMLIHKSFLHGG